MVAATMGAVVSKPTDVKTTSLSVFWAIFTALWTPLHHPDQTQATQTPGRDRVQDAAALQKN